MCMSFGTKCSQGFQKSTYRTEFQSFKVKLKSLPFKIRTFSAMLSGMHEGARFTTVTLIYINNTIFHIFFKTAFWTNSHEHHAFCCSGFLIASMTSLHALLLMLIAHRKKTQIIIFRGICAYYFDHIRILPTVNIFGCIMGSLYDILPFMVDVECCVFSSIC